MRRLTPEETGYLAGILDGEGSIILMKLGGSRRKLQPRVSVANTNLELMKWLKSVGGTYYRSHEACEPGCQLPRPLHTHNRVDSYRWRISCSQVIPILESVLPYLIIKKAKAILALDYAKEHYS